MSTSNSPQRRERASWVGPALLFLTLAGLVLGVLALVAFWLMWLGRGR